MTLRRSLNLLAAAALICSAAAAFCRLPDCPLSGALGMAVLLCLALTAALWTLRPLGGRGLWLAGALAAVLLLARILCFPVETSDYTDFLLPWTEKLRSLGGFPGLGREIGNYNVPYMVLLAFFSLLKTPVLYLIKFTSLLFDLLLAAVLALLVRRLGGSPGRAAGCFVLTLALPTVFLNSAVWGQCDSIYVSLALLGLYLCLAEKPGWGMAVFGVSFAFKLQAIFLLPVVAVLLMMKRVKWFHLPLFPAAYLLAVSPALIAGRSFGDTLLFYLNTAATAGSALSYNAPSLFSLYRFYWMDPEAQAAAGRAGIIAAAGVVLGVLTLCLVRRKRLDDRGCYLASLLFCLAIPLLLPHMHDRYFFFADAMTLVSACLLPWFSPAVLLCQFASLLGYHAYFFLRYLLPMKYGFFGLAAVCVCVLSLLLASLLGPSSCRERLAEQTSCRRGTDPGGGDEL